MTSSRRTRADGIRFAVSCAIVSEDWKEASDAYLSPFGKTYCLFRPNSIAKNWQFLAGLIGASRATSFTGLMIARVIHCFGSGVCEALPVQLVNDIFYLHERGKRIGYYTVCLCLGATGPLYAGYMLAGGYSWRLFFYVEAAFAGALLILAFLFVEETTYHRNRPTSSRAAERVLSQDSTKGFVEIQDCLSQVPNRKSFLTTLKPWGKIDHEADFFGTMIRPFSLFFVPAVFWVITTYGKPPVSSKYFIAES